jgi:hypothetical protein
LYRFDILSSKAIRQPLEALDALQGPNKEVINPTSKLGTESIPSSDSNLASTSSTIELQFTDERNKEVNIRNFLQWDYIDGPEGITAVSTESTPWSTSSTIRARSDLEPRVGQVLYALYLLHCRGCLHAMSMCPFPGCAIIRSEAFLEMQNDAGNE